MAVTRLNNGLLLTFCTVLASMYQVEDACALQKPFEDWIPASECQSVCQGYYSELPPPFPGQSTTFLNAQPITATSHRGQFPQEGPAILQGQVHLIQGNRQLFADETTLYRNPAGELETAIATGDVTILEPGLRVEGREATWNKAEDSQTVTPASFRLYTRHARGTASTLTIRGKTKMDLKEATYTTCAPFQNAWHLAASHVRLNKETGRGQARHARLYVKDIPVFYFPYVDFPIDDRRQTGFLYPSYGSSNNSGFELTAPFYWNIAPNYDATITPRYLSLRGLETKALFRYLSPNSVGDIEGSILPGDRAYKKFQQKHLHNHPLIPNSDPRVTGLKGNATRESLHFRHTTQFNRHWKSNVNYHRVGDDNFYYDFGNNLGTVSTTQLLQQAEMLYQDRSWYNALRVQQYQTLHPFSGPVTLDVYKKLPQFTFLNSNITPELPYGLRLGMSGDFTYFDHTKKRLFTTGGRFQARPSISLPIITPGWYLTPRLQMDILTDTLQLREQRKHALSLTPPTDLRFLSSSSPCRGIPMFDLDSGLIFERMTTFADCPYIQTLEPRAYYLNVPYRNQRRFPIFDTSFIPFDFNQLYRDNRFSGLDRLGDANQLTLGVTTRFLTTQTGEERLNLSVGQIYYFKERKVSVANHQLGADLEDPFRERAHSALAGRAQYRLDNTWSFYSGIEWDPKFKKANNRSAILQYRPHELDVINLGYLFMRKDPNNIINIRTKLPQRLEQTDASFAWRLTETWRVLGHWHYDITNHRTNDVLAGVEQQGCCTALRFTIVRFFPPDDPLSPIKKKYDTRFQIQFILKGFAGFGGNPQPFLVKAIPGYVWRGHEF